MKKTTTIGLMFVLILLVSWQANSQTKSSAMQIVTFAVSRSAQHAVNVLANLSSISTSSSSFETTTLQNSLKKCL